MPSKDISLMDESESGNNENSTNERSIVETIASKTTTDNEDDTTESESSEDDELDEEQRFDAVVIGMKCAALAITDEKDGSLARVAHLNPWHEEALKIITGSEEEAHKSLSYLLEKYMDLKLDCVLDEYGLSPGGQVLDTQGYIAHNDKSIVLAYRCTTSVFDWLTNLNTTCSEWEIEEDGTKGCSGYCSSLESLTLCGTGNDDYQPRVHTGFYNSFLASIPKIEEHILPLLFDKDEPPRRLYVVGHSLGAGIATLAASYFLMGSQFDWNKMPHSLFAVTAGSPRAVRGSMKDEVYDKLGQYGSNNVQFLRVVRHKDVVATVPAAMLGFQHLGALVHIARDGMITMDSDLPERDTDERRVRLAAQRHIDAQNILMAGADGTTNDATTHGTSFSVFSDSTAAAKSSNTSYDTSQSSYKRKISRIPKAFRDHMPDFYLNPMKHSSHHGTFPDSESEDGYDGEIIRNHTTFEEEDGKKRMRFSRPVASLRNKKKENGTERAKVGTNPARKLFSAMRTRSQRFRKRKKNTAEGEDDAADDVDDALGEEIPLEQ